MQMIEILIIEDDLRLATELTKMIEQLPIEANVCGVLSSVKESIDWFSANPMPSIILSDIELTDGNSFDIFASILITAPVIFCTAYDQYALQAFKNNGVDYILKPIEQEKLQKSFDRIIQMQKSLTPAETISSPARYHNVIKELSHAYKTTLLVYYKNKIIPVYISNIKFLRYSFMTVYVHTENEKFEVKEKLDDLMLSLPARDFFRANRQVIINRNSILDIEPLSTRKLSVKLNVENSESIIVSKEKAAEFLKWIEWA
ncbi:LytTR family DNA-binding domain-containing protein [Dyadobacter sp. LHD-138]|uniref:LytR/AlgR family response regulator transcription factor n=1 Tax=Dyadobacter sp. LHD-138 TaxID=3071413 RepID=UPI0027DED56D|nr:LytTR family DNA-binding domain-containing protein [Dyadobacter sp. LHD-138]MDQ6482050.1 LytTR family DNA-binding domain-containing protein [Dyadobacter sp. LHD-138]